MTKEKMLEVQTVANRLRIGVSTVYRLVKTGQLQHNKMGPKKAIRIPEKAVMLAERYGFDYQEED